MPSSRPSTPTDQWDLFAPPRATAVPAAAHAPAADPMAGSEAGRPAPPVTAAPSAAAIDAPAPAARGARPLPEVVVPPDIPPADPLHPKNPWEWTGRVPLVPARERYRYAAMDAPPPSVPDAAVIPVRSVRLEAAPGAVASLNARERRRGVRAYEDTPAAEDRARGARTMARERLLTLLTHPSESVVIALLHNSTDPSPFKHEHWEVMDTVYQRAMAEADRDGFIWTPLLDALDEKGAWPDSLRTRYPRSAPEAVSANPETNDATTLDDPGVAAAPVATEEGAADDPFATPDDADIADILDASDRPTARGSEYPWRLFPEFEATKGWVSADERLARLGPWVRAQCDAAATWEVVSAFRSDRLKRLVLAELPVWDRPFLVQMLKDRPADAAVIARNPALGASLQTSLAWWTTSQLADVTVPADADALPDAKRPPAYSSRWSRHHEPGAAAAHTVLAGLVGAGWAPPRAFVDALLAVATAPRRPARKVVRWDTAAGSRTPVLEALAALGPHVTDSELGTVAAQCTDLAEQQVLLAAPAAGLAVYRALATGKGHTRIRETLVRLPAARDDATVRDALAKSTNASVLFALAFAATSELEFRRIMVRALRSGADAAVSRLLGVEPWLGDLQYSHRGTAWGNRLQGPVFSLDPQSLHSLWAAAPAVQIRGLALLERYRWPGDEEAAAARRLFLEQLPHVLRACAGHPELDLRDEAGIASSLRELLGWLGRRPGVQPLTAADIAASFPQLTSSQAGGSLARAIPTVYRDILRLLRELPLDPEARGQVWIEHARRAGAILEAALATTSEHEVAKVLEDHAIMAWVTPEAMAPVLLRPEAWLRDLAMTTMAVVGAGRSTLTPDDRAALVLAEAATCARATETSAPVAPRATAPVTPARQQRRR